jgi:hypothetical protein
MGIKIDSVPNWLVIFAFIITPLAGVALVIAFCLWWLKVPSRIELEATQSIQKMYNEMADLNSAFNQNFSKDVAAKMQLSIQKVLEYKNKDLFKGNNQLQPIDGPFAENPLKKLDEKVIPVLNAIREKVETLPPSKPGSVNDANSSKSDISALKARFDKLDIKLSEVEVLVKANTPKQESGSNTGKSVDVDVNKLKTALISELGTSISKFQNELAKKMGELSAKVDANGTQLGSRIDKMEKNLGAQQDVKKVSQYQPVYMIVLSNGFRPQRDAIGIIVQKLVTPDSNSSSKISPTVLLSADGNRQGVLSMAGLNQGGLTTWLDNNDLREIKPQIDALPLIVSDKITGGGQPQHMVVLLGHNVQLDKTKDLSAWEKLESLTFVVIEPPNLGNFSWENLRKIKDVRKAKGRKTDIRIFKTVNEMDSTFKLEIEEIDEIAALMKTSVGQ